MGTVQTCSALHGGCLSEPCCRAAITPASSGAPGFAVNDIQVGLYAGQKLGVAIQLLHNLPEAVAARRPSLLPLLLLLACQRPPHVRQLGQAAQLNARYWVLRCSKWGSPVS